MDINVQNELISILQDIDRSKMELTAMKFQAEMPSSYPGQYTGKPIPTRIGGTCTIHQSDPALRYQLTVPVSADGPFYAKSIHINFKDMYDSRWHDVGLFDSFYWGYRVSGSERERQNVPVPSFLLHRAEDGGAGFYELVPQDAFPKSSTVTIWIELWFAPSRIFVQDVTMWAGFNGFYVLE